MTVRGIAGSRSRRWVAAAITAVVACSAAGVALASTGAVLTTQRDLDNRTMVAARNGHTLYMFHRDGGGKSYCYGTCTKTWKPDITYGRPTTPSGSGLNPYLLGTIRRTNGAKQVTYNGHPLYFYSGDTSVAVTNGEGLYQFHGYWYEVGPRGKVVWPCSNCY